MIDLVAGPLVVNATNADNAINYTQGSGRPPTAWSASMTYETIEFSNKTTLTINGLAGSDTINLNNPNTPTGLTGITVNGGDPTGSDTLIVNGTALARYRHVHAHVRQFWIADRIERAREFPNDGARRLQRPGRRRHVEYPRHGRQ